MPTDSPHTTSASSGPAKDSGPNPTAVIETIDELRTYRAQLDGAVALIPTMGALHEGHLQHIRLCKTLADHVVVSLFVNPTQFNQEDDYRAYPRTMELDIRACAEAGADCVFTPSTGEIYPPGQIAVQIDVPAVSGVLEGADRPGHFQGVCRVVTKLLNIVSPDMVSFGRKDYQQLAIIKAVVGDLMMPIRVIEVPTVREADGLAMSSRNRRLDTDQRRRALGLFKALCAGKRMVEEDGESDPQAVEQAMRALMESHQVEVAYSAVRHPKTLDTLSCIEPRLTRGVVALVAGHVGPIRLIDNMQLGGGA